MCSDWGKGHLKRNASKMGQKAKKHSAMFLDKLTDEAAIEDMMSPTGAKNTIIQEVHGDGRNSPLSPPRPSRSSLRNRTGPVRGGETLNPLASAEPAPAHTPQPSARAAMGPHEPLHFTLRFSRQAPLGLGLVEENFRDEAGAEHRVVRVAKVEPGGYAASYASAGLCEGVILEFIGGQDVDTLTMRECHRMLTARPAELTFGRFAPVPGARAPPPAPPRPSAAALGVAPQLEVESGMAATAAAPSTTLASRADFTARGVTEL